MEPVSVTIVIIPLNSSSPIALMDGIFLTILGVWQFMGGTKNKPTKKYCK